MTRRKGMRKGKRIKTSENKGEYEEEEKGEEEKE